MPKEKTATHMTTIVRPGQTVSTQGPGDFRLTGNDTLNDFMLAPGTPGTPQTLNVMATGQNNAVNITAELFSRYAANIDVKSGNLTLHPDMTGASAAVTVTGHGHANVSATLGGRSGIGSKLTIDARHDSSHVSLISGGTVEFGKLAFIQSADVTVNDIGEPAGGLFAPIPVLQIDGVKDLHDIAYSQAGGLTLDFAHGKSQTIAGLHISDPQFYSLIQNASGDVTITPTAVQTGFGGPSGPPTFAYVAPTAPVGGHVFQL